MMRTEHPPLDALGDRLETAVRHRSAVQGIGTGAPQPRRFRPLALLPALGVFAVVVVLAAALWPGGGTSAEAAVKGAAKQTFEASTGRFELTMASSGALGSLDLALIGAYDIPNQRLAASVDVAQILDEAGGLGGNIPQMLGTDTTVELVVDGDTVYVQSGLLGLLGGSADSWMSLDVSETTGASLWGDIPLDAVASASFLEGLAEIAGPVEEVGAGTIRGTGTTHYRGQIDVNEVLADLPDDQRGEIEKIMPGDLTLPTVPIDVWIDDQEMVRRIEIRLSLDEVVGGNDLAGQVGDVKVAMEYFDIGEPVDIEVPQDAQPLDLGDTLGGLNLDGLPNSAIEEFDLDGLMEQFGEFDLEFDLDGLMEQFGEFDLEFDLDGLMEQFEGFNFEFDFDLDGLGEQFEGLTEDFGGGMDEFFGDDGNVEQFFDDLLEDPFDSPVPDTTIPQGGSGPI